MEEKICPQCRKAIDKDSLFCSKCGFSLASDSLPENGVDSVDAVDSNVIITKRLDLKRWKKIAIILCIGVALIFGICTIVSNNFSSDEKYALTKVEKYQDMLKNPDSMILRSDVIVVRKIVDDEYTSYCFFTASGENSYGASVSSTACFKDGQYICDASEIPEREELRELDAEDAKMYLNLNLALLEWRLYGESATEEVEGTLESYAVDGNKIARKMGIECSVDD